MASGLIQGEIAMTDKDINEAQTRKQFIDAALKQAGWAPILPYRADECHEHGCVEEYPTGEGFADYILFHEGKALACIEGKRVRVGAGQEKWLALIQRHLLENLMMEKEDVDFLPIFTREGVSWGKLDRIFSGELETIIREINLAIAA
jgi:hypothetical protein